MNGSKLYKTFPVPIHMDAHSLTGRKEDMLTLLAFRKITSNLAFVVLFYYISINIKRKDRPLQKVRNEIRKLTLILELTITKLLLNLSYHYEIV